MEIISRKEALKQGLDRYFTGKICIHGHLSGRTVQGWKCIECSSERDRTRYIENPEYFAVKNKRWCDANKDHIRTNKSSKRQEHLQLIKFSDVVKQKDLPKIREDARRLGLIHYFTGSPCRNGHIANRLVSSGVCTVCQLERLRNDREMYPERHRVYKVNRRLLEIKATPSWLAPEQRSAILEIYTEAVHLTKTNGAQYDVDHRVPLQGKIISGLHVPENLCVLLHKENMVKHNRFNRVKEEQQYFDWLKARSL
jgi:hypothetical protein